MDIPWHDWLVILIEDFLLIFQPTIFFFKSLLKSCIPNKPKQIIFGDYEPKTSQLLQEISILRTSCLQFLAVFNIEEKYFLYFVSLMKSNLIAIEGTR
jgi:hypothetical protein